MVAKVEIKQETIYKNYKGDIDKYSDTLHFEFDNLDAAKSLVDAFPDDEVVGIEVTMAVTLKDRNTVKDGEEQ